MNLKKSPADPVFTDGRSHSKWLPKAVSEQQIRALYELAKWCPTSMNCQPMRVRFVVSPDAKKSLLECLYEGNQAKAAGAPVIAIIGQDLAFPDTLPRLFPHKTDAQSYYAGKPDLVASTALRNSSLQGAFLIMAARTMGLDCGPMSGFDAPAVDRLFWAGTTVKTNFVCNLGYADHSAVKPRGARLSFEEACTLV